MLVQPGYHIDRDKEGVTAREREMLDCLQDGFTITEAAKQIGVSQQRASAIVRSLELKGKIRRNHTRGEKK